MEEFTEMAWRVMELSDEELKELLKGWADEDREEDDDCGETTVKEILEKFENLKDDYLVVTGSRGAANTRVSEDSWLVIAHKLKDLPRITTRQPGFVNKLNVGEELKHNRLDGWG